MSDQQQPDLWEQAGQDIGQVGGAAAGWAINTALDLGTDGIGAVLDPAIETSATNLGGSVGDELGAGAEALWDDLTGSPDSGSSAPGSNDPGSSDPGSTDTGSMDAQSTDAGSLDAGSTDTGSMDAQSTDAGFSTASRCGSATS